MYCSNCGKEIPSQSRFCKWCGATISPAQTQQKTSGTQDIPTGNSAQSESGVDDVMDYLVGSVRVAAELFPPSRKKAFFYAIRNAIFAFLIFFVVWILVIFGLSSNLMEWDYIPLIFLTGFLAMVLTGIISYVVCYRRANQKYEEERRRAGKR